MAITKRYRFVVDYEVQVEDWTDAELAGAREEYKQVQDYPDWEEKQRKLFVQLTKNPERLEQYCRRALLDVAELDLESLHQQFHVPEENELLAQAFEELPSEEVKYWNELFQSEWFFENTQLTRDRIQPYLTSCKVVNVETGDEIRSKSNEPGEGETFVHSVEAFGTWADDDDNDDDPDLAEMLNQISLPKASTNDIIPADIKEFLQGFAVARTVFTHVDPVTREAEYTREQIAKECNEWVKNNSIFTKDDLSCLRQLLRKQGYSKLHLHNLLQDMRGKTFFDLSKAFLSGTYTAPPSMLAS
jgi:hypothetical protein